MEWKKVIQKAGPLRLGVVVLCGILLLLISCGSLPFGEKDSGRTEAESDAAVQENIESSNLQNFRERTKEELVTLLEGVEGVGHVDVMITVRASNEKVTLKDSTNKEGGSQEETVLIEDSERNSSPYVIQEKEPELEGVVVVCDGGDDAVVKREITDAVGALFQIESHKIKVMKSKEAKE